MHARVSKLSSVEKPEGVATISKDAYLSAEFVKLERERLWPKVWQVACREEELPRVGSFVTYDILNESVIVIRTRTDKIQAFNNACLHRGRQLTTGCGHAQRFVCRYHGWKWNIDGSLHEVIDREDWKGRLTDDSIRLPEYACATWGGFVFINFDPRAEPLLDYLAPVPEYLDCLEFERLRFTRYVTLEIPANWKTAQEAFMEAYHIQTTHRQAAPYMDPRSITQGRGKHSQMSDNFPPTIGVHVGGSPISERDSFIELVRAMAIGNSPFGSRALGAATRLRELPEDTPYMQAAAKWLEHLKEAGIATGAGFPRATPEELFKAGVDWNIFPNLTMVMSPDASLWYRVRPMGDDPNRCLFDIWWLERYAEGTEPKLQRQHYSDWKEFEGLGPVLTQDFENIPFVQRGMQTSGFQRAIPHPVQEEGILHFHRVLRSYLFDT
jgi:phenylpropionate dioxygenase-like ring-hydroxylating dioxygenase large terminal subunit